MDLATGQQRVDHCCAPGGSRPSSERTNPDSPFEAFTDIAGPAVEQVVVELVDTRSSGW